MGSIIDTLRNSLSSTQTNVSESEDNIKTKVMTKDLNNMKIIELNKSCVQTIDTNISEENIISTKRIEFETNNDRNDSKDDKSLVNKTHDSYDNRFCDDLSEDILQYLSLEDKLRLECVSQQFRRTLFTKHYSLKVTSKMREMSLESIEKLIKKLPKLCEIEFYDYDYDHGHFLEYKQMIVKSLIKNCNNLSKIYLNTNYNLMNEKFIDKFGSTLVSLEIGFNCYVDPQIITKLSNIEELIVEKLPDLSDVNFRRLKRLEIHEINDYELEDLKLLIEDNRNTLKHLIIDYYETEKESSLCKTLFTLIPKLKNLVNLEIGLDLFELFDKQFDTYLTQIALNCNQLKRLCFDYTIDDYIGLIDGQSNSFEDLLSSLKKFKALKRLDLSLFYKLPLINQNSPEINLSSLLKCEAFREWTHLNLNIIAYYGLTIDANVMFKNIEKNLPKLQSLIINKIKFKCNENTAHILSGLSNLQTISLEMTTDSPKDEIETKLKEKCKRITRIDIKNNI